MRQIADWIAAVLADPTDEDLIRGVRGSIGEMCQAFPLYQELAARA
jgi:glycine/serine hydroxymethyltransferase